MRSIRPAFDGARYQDWPDETRGQTGEYSRAPARGVVTAYFCYLARQVLTANCRQMIFTPAPGRLGELVRSGAGR